MAVTASDLINEGEYLREGYDPTRLTIPLLTGILSHHGVHLQARDKASLVRAFRERISPQKAKLSRERIARAETKASDEGITDGMTGKQVNRQRKSLARYQYEEEEEEETPSKPARGKARPSTNYQAPVKFDDDESEDEVVEDSEPEDALPRSTKRRVSKGRRLSDITGREKLSNEDSDSEEVGNWSTDHNPFQQGGSSSSPVDEDRRRSVNRKSLPSRKSMSREPPSPARVPKSNSRRSIVAAPPPPQADSSSPEPYEESPPRRQSRAHRQSDHWQTSTPETRRMSVTSPQYDEFANEEDDDEYADQEEDDEYAAYNSAIADRLANRQAVQKGPPFFTPGRTIVFALSLLFLGSFIAKYRFDSAPLGFCDVNSNTNELVEANKLVYESQAECSAQIAKARALTKGMDAAEPGAAIDDEWDCTPLPLVPFPRATKCTPCPKHAVQCTRTSVTCEPGYTLTPHVFDRIPLASLMFNGVPGLGSVAFPPSCAVDKQRRNTVSLVAQALELHLATKRGEKLCAGSEDEGSTAEAVTWGVPVLELKERARTRMQRLAQSGNFDDIFNGAMEELKKAHQIVEGTDSSGIKYCASKRDETSLSCSVRIRARHVWGAWRGTVIGLIVVAFSGLYVRYQIARRSRDKAEVARLVQTSLDALRSQQIAYNADPSSVIAPYLPPAQLRDWVLQNEHSVSARKRLWKQVERVVESNANVRANVEEVDGGEETRVWKWVGASQAPIQHAQAMPLPRPIA